MIKKPEALRLADDLSRWLIVSAETRLLAAAELRRLHALNNELLSALRQALPLLQELSDADGYASTTSHRAFESARLAIAKLEIEL